MKLKKRNKRNDEREREPETQEELMEKYLYVYFDNEEELEQYIKYHKIKNFEYTERPRTIIFPASELIKEK